MIRIDFARDFARRAHGDQKYGDEPYLTHLDAVADIVWWYGDDYVEAAYLHDVVEDTPLVYADLGRFFTGYIVQAVALMSDPPGLPTRAQRKEIMLRRWKLLSPDRPDQPAEKITLVVKPADRLANVRAGTKNDMYRREHAAFREALYRPGLCDSIWSEIDRILASP